MLAERKAGGVGLIYQIDTAMTMRFSCASYVVNSAQSSHFMVF